jgi:hypothetical protein
MLVKPIHCIKESEGLRVEVRRIYVRIEVLHNMWTLQPGGEVTVNGSNFPYNFHVPHQFTLHQ